jgi:hypothetical protein
MVRLGWVAAGFSLAFFACSDTDSADAPRSDGVAGSAGVADAAGAAGDQGRAGLGGTPDDGAGQAGSSGFVSDGGSGSDPGAGGAGGAVSNPCSEAPTCVSTGTDGCRCDLDCTKLYVMVCDKSSCYCIAGGMPQGAATGADCGDPSSLQYSWSDCGFPGW